MGTRDMRSAMWEVNPRPVFRRGHAKGNLGVTGFPSRFLGAFCASTYRNRAPHKNPAPTHVDAADECAAVDNESESIMFSCRYRALRNLRGWRFRRINRMGRRDG